MPPTPSSSPNSCRRQAAAAATARRKLAKRALHVGNVLLLLLTADWVLQQPEVWGSHTEQAAGAPCPVGSWCAARPDVHDNQTCPYGMCAACPNGRYGNVSGASSFAAACYGTCPRGYYSNASSSVSHNRTDDVLLYKIDMTCGDQNPPTTGCGSLGCTAEQPGASSNETAWRTFKGRYSAVSSADSPLSCSSCPAGKWSSADVASECTACPLGRFRASAAISNSSNATGLLAAAGGMSSCLPCAPGRYASDPAGSPACLFVGAGRYAVACADNASRSACANTAPCPLGHACDGRGNATPCTPGYFSSYDGAPSCSACARGQYADMRGLVFCKSCPSGQYQDAETSTSCKHCPRGYVTLEATEATEDDSAAAPSGAVSCTSCDAGSYGAAWNRCDPCGLGKYRSSTYPNGSATDPSVCLNCRRGEYTRAHGSTSCDACDLGRFGSAPGLCSLCPVGTYQNGRGETRCQPCPEDTYGVSEGQTSRAQCEACPARRTTNGTTGNAADLECVCVAGFYYDDTGRTGNATQCSPCPSGANCVDRVNLSLSRMPAQPGYWRAGKHATELHRCAYAEDCVGGEPGPNQCRSGHGGVLCAVCDAGFVRLPGSDGCAPCGDGVSTNGSTGITIVATALPGVLLLGLIIHFCKTRQEQPEPPTSSSSKVEPLRVNAVPKRVDKRAAAKTKESHKANKTMERTESRLFGMKSRNSHQTMAKIRAVNAIGNTMHLNTVASDVAGLVGDAVAEEIQGHQDGLLAEVTGDTAGGSISIGTSDILENILSSNRPDTAATGLLRIIVGYLQITSAFLFSFEIPWPANFLALVNALTVVNFNFMDFVVPFDACTFYTPFLKQAYFHMSIVPLCATVIAIAGLLVCGCRNQGHRRIVLHRAKSVLVALVFLLCK